MNSLQNRKPDIILAVYQNKKTVFRLRDIAMLTGERSFESINKKLNSLVQKGKLLNPRKGIYVKKDYNKEEMACNLFTPAYISLEYVLQKAGVIFQYNPAITTVSYLSRTLAIDNSSYVFRKIKNQVLVNTRGIQRLDNHINIATPERAFLDVLYLNPTYYFDNLNPLDVDSISGLLPLYNSKALTARAKSTLSYA
ncbi:MAG: hypothetical protein ACFCUM_05715 [Bacteroidales bacterium]